MFLKCFLIPLSFASIVSILKVFFWHLHLYLSENGGLLLRGRLWQGKGKEGKEFDLVCADYETNCPPQLFGMVYLDQFNFLYHS